MHVYSNRYCVPHICYYILFSTNILMYTMFYTHTLITNSALNIFPGGHQNVQVTITHFKCIYGRKAFMNVFSAGITFAHTSAEQKNKVLVAGKQACEPRHRISSDGHRQGGKPARPPVPRTEVGVRLRGHRAGLFPSGRRHGLKNVLAPVHTILS